MPTVFALAVLATLAWAWTGGVDQVGLPYGPPGDPVVVAPGATPGLAGMPRLPGVSGLTGLPGVAGAPAAAAGVEAAPGTPSPGDPATSGATAPAASPPPPGIAQVLPRRTSSGPCRTGVNLVPTCGVLWGVAPGAFTDARGQQALAAFERKTERHQDIFHAYHNGQRQLFPTKTEIAIARQKGKERILLLNWKPVGVSWAKIAKGDPRTDAFLDRLAVHINHSFRERFFFAIHHEAEDQVREKKGSGYEAEDYAAMFRHVVLRLRAHGVHNAVTVLIHMAYVPHTSESWFEDMYPGDSVVDWIGFDTYAYSDPGYGHGDFAELLNRRSKAKPNWPGFYNWAKKKHPNKPLMVAEWGVWSSKRNPGHKAEFYREVGQQIRQFPNIRALIHFDTPHSPAGRDSRVDTTPEALRAYRWLGHLPIFQVEVRPLLP